MRRSLAFLLLIASQLLLFAAMLLVAGHVRHQRVGQELEARRTLVRTLGLTDLAVWTEARYTRNPSQADFFSAFQDLPGSLEHFPAGSVVEAPAAHPGPGE